RRSCLGSDCKGEGFSATHLHTRKEENTASRPASGSFHRAEAASTQKMKSYQKLTTDILQIPEAGEEAVDGRPLCHQKLSAWWLGGGLLMVAALLSGVTVWVLGQIWWSQHGTSPLPKCISIPEELRFDCYPERNTVVTRELCEARGCCFVDSDQSSGSTSGVPWCFYPPDFPSYTLGSMNETELGLVGFLTRKAKAYYPKDIEKLQLSVEFETDTRLHVKITDATTPRYEVPLEVPPVTKRAENPIYAVEFSKEPFGLIVKRKSSGTVLLNTTVAPLFFADQFLQVSTLLPSSYLYGLGEHRTNFLHSLEWNTLTFWARDVPPTETFNLYGVHPFYLVMEKGGAAHGVFLLNSNAMEVALQPAPALTWRTIGGVLDFYIFLGPDPNLVVQQYQQVIGFPAMPPYWGLGFHLCRWGYGTSNATWETVKAMRNFQIPQDAQWNDIDYMDGYRDFTIDSQKFGALPQLDPGISSTQPPGSYWPYDEGLKHGIFINNTQGEPLIGKVWPGLTAYPDFSNPNTHQWWLENLNRFHSLVPFDGVWIDMNEPSNFMDGSSEGCSQGEMDTPPYVPGKKKSMLDSLGFEQVHALIKLRGKRPFIISRSTFPSQGKYSGHWLGDNRSNWKDMVWSIPGMLSFSLFGIPLVGADICGFSGSTSEELCTRWMQLGAFYPFSRNHNTQNEKAQDPPAFSPAARTAMKAALEVRYSLLPYLYSLFHRAHLQGDTVARPLLFEFPNDVATYSIDKQFLWGRGLLVTPVLDPGVDWVIGYFPKGVWYDYYTGSLVNSSGENLKMAAPLDHINVHVREGTILPTQKPGCCTLVSRGNPLRLIAALSQNANAWGDLYWDDGESLDAFAKGDYSYLVFNVTQNTFTSAVLHSNVEATYITVDILTVYGVREEPKTVTVNGKEWPFSYLTNQVLTMSDLQLNLSQGFSIRWV
ncbi:hypothetical protein JD844_020013, partial [Phrynosoma platyrhinos]